MSSFVYRSTGVAIRLVSKLLSLNFSSTGKENLYDGPTLYVVNHFTRFETLLLPYILYKTTGKSVKTLAKESLFKGVLGTYLSKLGAISRKDPNRNKSIISDMMTGASNWVIYPEGLMVKNKLTIDEDGKISLKTPYYNGLPRTGAAVMALKAEAIKQLVWKNLREKKLSAARKLLKRFELKPRHLSKKPLKVIPTTITYYPMRFKNKNSQKFIKALSGKKTLPLRVREELQVEAALIANAEVMVSFSAPVEPAEYIRNSLFNLVNTRVIDDRTMIDIATHRHRYKLTKRFMRSIYQNLFIHCDHLLALLLFRTPLSEISRNEMKQYLYATIVYLYESDKKFNLHKMLFKNLADLISVNENPQSPIIMAINNFIAYAKKNDYLKEEKKTIKPLKKKQKVYLIDKIKTTTSTKFENIRVESPIKVIYNEFSPMLSLMPKLISALDMGLLSPFTEKEKTADILLRYCMAHFSREREKYATEHEVKEWGIGKPRYLPLKEGGGFTLTTKKEKTSPRCAVVLSHGYKSSPYEILGLGKHLYGLGYAVFMPRMPGHGTYDDAMKNVQWQQWVDAYKHTALALAKDYDKVFLMGFSAGGLLALQTAATFYRKINIAGVVTISTPFVLKNVLFKLPTYIEKWNTLCKSIGMQSLSYDFIEETVEHNNTNYQKNFMHGISELDSMISSTKKILKEVKSPMLAIQGANDPVVDSESAFIINRTISSRDKSLILLKRKNHVIVRGFGCGEVFERVDSFVKEHS